MQWWPELYSRYGQNKAYKVVPSPHCSYTLCTWHAICLFISYLPVLLPSNIFVLKVPLISLIHKDLPFMVYISFLLDSQNAHLTLITIEFCLPLPWPSYQLIKIILYCWTTIFIINSTANVCVISKLLIIALTLTSMYIRYGKGPTLIPMVHCWFHVSNHKSKPQPSPTVSKDQSNF